MCVPLGDGRINEVTRRRARLVLRWVTIRRYAVMVGNIHSGQLNLLLSAGRQMSTNQGAVAELCDWEGNRGSGVTLAMYYI